MLSPSNSKLINLPTELLHQIIAHFDTNKELNTLQTCKLLYTLANPHLYQTSTTQKATDVLFWAAAKGRAPTAKRRLEYGADIHASSPETVPVGLTFLFIAAQEDHPAVVDLLLAHEQPGAPSVRDAAVWPGEGRSVLSYAAESRSAQVVEYLLSREDIDADAADRGGATPLWRDADIGQPTTLRLLLDTNKVDVSFRHRGHGEAHGRPTGY
ncbi:ankyrin repeat-containing domain protein, partial [Aspergillus filifer]